MPKLSVDLLKPEVNDKEFKGKQGDDRQVRVRVVVSGATDPTKVTVKAGTGPTLATTFPTEPLNQEGATLIWSNWVDLKYAVFFVRVVAVEGVKDAYDHGGPISDDGS